MVTAERVISGTFGSLFDQDGNFMNEVTSFEARFTKNRSEIFLAGDKATHYKGTSTSGEITITMYKVTSDLLEKATREIRNQRAVPFIGEFIGKLDDPESFGTERVRFKNVKLWEIPLSWQNNEIVEQTVTCTFEGFDFLDRIVDPDRPST